MLSSAVSCRSVNNFKQMKCWYISEFLKPCPDFPEAGVAMSLVRCSLCKKFLEWNTGTVSRCCNRKWYVWSTLCVCVCEHVYMCVCACMCTCVCECVFTWGCVCSVVCRLQSCIPWTYPVFIFGDSPIFKRACFLFFRFRKFYKLEDDRKVMLLNHVVFLEKPSVERCFFHTSMSEECSCTECTVSNILRNERRLVPNGK